MLPAQTSEVDSQTRKSPNGRRKRCLALGKCLGTASAATQALPRPPFGRDFVIDLWDAEDPDFRASRVCPETYRLRDTGITVPVRGRLII